MGKRAPLHPPAAAGEGREEAGQEDGSLRSLSTTLLRHPQDKHERD